MNSSLYKCKTLLVYIINMNMCRLNHYNYLSKSCRFLILSSLLCVLTFHCAKNLSSDNSPWSVRMAESVMARHPHIYGDWDYVTGTVLEAFAQLWSKTGDDRYFQYIKSTVDSVVNSDGAIYDYKLSNYNLDEINEGRMLLFLYKETGEEKYKKAAQLLRSQLADQPRNSQGGFWHKKRYPYQMWLDGLYMGSPFYTEYGKLFDEPENFDDVVRQFVLMETHARDTTTGLLYHGWDEKKQQEWADPITGCSPVFWGRAIGWYAMALVDVLDYLPADHPGRGDLIAILQRLSQAIAQAHDDLKDVWWQVVDQPGQEGNYLEASASCMFVYALAKASRLGYVDRTYGKVAKKAYQAILKEFITENQDGTINLIRICKSAGLGYGRDGSYDYYVYQEEKVQNDGKGVGPFIVASLEMERQ